MFRAEIRWLDRGPTLKLTGKLAGDWAEQARELVTNDVVPKGLIVDLTDVSYIDSIGEELLKWLASLGAVFVAGNVYAVAVCERLRLPPVQAERHNRRCGNNDERSSIGCFTHAKTCEAEEKKESHVLVSLDEKCGRSS